MSGLPSLTAEGRLFCLVFFSSSLLQKRRRERGVRKKCTNGEQQMREEVLKLLRCVGKGHEVLGEALLKEHVDGASLLRLQEPELLRLCPKLGPVKRLLSDIFELCVAL